MQKQRNGRQNQRMHFLRWIILHTACSSSATVTQPLNHGVHHAVHSTVNLGAKRQITIEKPSCTWVLLTFLDRYMSSSTTAASHGGMSPVMESAREVSGWRFSCHKAPAMSSVQREQMATELGLHPAIPLPEVVFANSSLEILHLASGLTIHFDAREALHKWIEDNKGVVDQWEPSVFDFTYSTSYSGTVSQEGRSLKITQTSEPLPLEKLQQQVAILFYDRVLLFEDDIRDLGEIYVEVRIRVMEFGFLMLCRYYCRIDDKQTLKMLDTRYYHEFGDAFVWRDNEIRESTVADIKRVFNARTEDQYGAPVDLSGDVVYGVLRPASTTTEKIHLVQSS